MPVDIEKNIENTDAVFTLAEVIDRIDLRRFLAVKDSRMGRARYDGMKLLKVILFAFMENGYASDMDCFQPLMERFFKAHSKYPEYPVADAGYGSFNNYLYCEEHGMKKYMKFTMYEKETKDKDYREDPYRAVNFPINENGCPVCPNGKEFHYLKTAPVKGNKYGRTEEYYQCEDCSDCPHKASCCKSEGNRTVRLNEELTSIHKEVLENLNCIHGALLRMNRSIQAEGVFGGVKWNRTYSRARRRGLKGLILEIGLIFCGFNLHKYYLNKLKARKKAA